MGVLRLNRLVVIDTPAKSSGGRLFESRKRKGRKPSRGSVQDIVQVFKGDLVVPQGTVVQGDVVNVGGSIDVEPGSVVQGDAVSIFGSTTVQQGGVVLGDTAAVLGTVEVERGGQVMGEHINIGLGKIFGRARKAKPRSMLSHLGPFGLFPSLALFAVIYLLGLLGLRVWPERIRSVGHAMFEQPVRSFVVGFLCWLLLLPVVILLFMSIVGIPLVPLLPVAMFLAVVMGISALALRMGEAMPAGPGERVVPRAGGAPEARSRRRPQGRIARERRAPASPHRQARRSGRGGAPRYRRRRRQSRRADRAPRAPCGDQAAGAGRGQQSRGPERARCRRVRPAQARRPDRRSLPHAGGGPRGCRGGGPRRDHGQASRARRRRLRLRAEGHRRARELPRSAWRRARNPGDGRPTSRQGQGCARRERRTERGRSAHRPASHPAPRSLRSLRPGLGVGGSRGGRRRDSRAAGTGFRAAVPERWGSRPDEVAHGGRIARGGPGGGSFLARTPRLGGDRASGFPGERTMSGKLGDILIQQAVIDEQKLIAALADQRAFGGKLGRTLVDLGYVTEEQLVQALATQLGLTTIDLEEVNPPPEALACLPADACKRYGVFPIRVDPAQRLLWVATAEPEREPLGEVARIARHTLEP